VPVPRFAFVCTDRRSAHWCATLMRAATGSMGILLKTRALRRSRHNRNRLYGPLRLAIAAPMRCYAFNLDLPPIRARCSGRSTRPNSPDPGNASDRNGVRSQSNLKSSADFRFVRPGDMNARVAIIGIVHGFDGKHRAVSATDYHSFIPINSRLCLDYPLSINSPVPLADWQIQSLGRRFGRAR